MAKRCKVYSVLFFTLLLSICISAQKPYNVMDWKTDVTLNTFLVQQMKKQYEQRRIEFDKAVASRQNAEQYVESVRNKFASLLPELPKKTKLNAKVTGVIRQENYTIEKISYESFPGHHVTCNLYLPSGNGPFPAALLFCGHEDVSKATDSYQRTAILFAKNGFAVFVIDPISQSERYQLTDKNGKPLTRGGTTEHTLLNEASNLFGWSAPADELWDNIRGLDYLSTRKEIDMNRVGCLGNSGGGMQTMYFSAFESRVKVIAVCSFLMSRERALELSGPSDGCSQIPNEGKAGLEMSDLLIASAAKPVLILAGRYDFIDYIGTTGAFNELKKVYSALGHADKTKLFTYDDGHGISLPKREEAVRWFKKWLMNDSSKVKEEPVNTLSDKDLFVTKSGQVITEFPKEVSLAERNNRLFKSSEASRKKFLKGNRNEIIGQIRELLSIDTDTSAVDVQETGTVIRNNILYHKFIFRRGNQPPVPALVIYPESGIKKVILWLHESGKNRLADSVSFMNSALQQQAAIVLADLRGMGETEDRADMNDPKYYNREYRNAMLALHIGKPLAGQRVVDISTLIKFINTFPRFKSLPLEVNAYGAAALPALHAALFEDNLNTLTLYAPMDSFQEILKDPVAKNWYSYVIPGVLNYYDIPDLIKLLGSKKISIVEYASESRTW